VPWEVLGASWEHILRTGDVIEAFNLGLFLLFTILLLLGLRRLPFAYTAFAAPQLLLISGHERMASPLAASSRYMLTLFPIFVLLALLGRDRRLHYSYLIVSLLLLGFLLYAFLSGYWVA